MQQEDPFPLLALPDLVLQHVLTSLSLLERKAVRATCRKLCKVCIWQGSRVFTMALDMLAQAEQSTESGLTYLVAHSGRKRGSTPFPC
jgi:hypothetical protein